MKTLIKIIVPIMLFTCGCSKKNNVSHSNVIQVSSTSYDYDIVKDKMITWNDLLSQELERYDVYIYSTTCLHCLEIKQEIIECSLNRDDFFFIEYNKSIPVSDDVSETVGEDDLDKITILGTPALLIVENGILVVNVSGPKAILQAL